MSTPAELLEKVEAVRIASTRASDILGNRPAPAPVLTAVLQTLASACDDLLRTAPALAADPEQERLRDELLDRYRPLAMKSNLTPAEEAEFLHVDSLLREIEHKDAEAVEAQFTFTRAGRLDKALDRIEEQVHLLLAEGGQRKSQ